MKIINTTKGITLSYNAEYDPSILGAIWGLMLKPPQDLILDLRAYGGIHTFFMFYPIDVIFVDENHRVVDCRVQVQPNRFYCPQKWEARYVIELGVGELGTTEPGDYLQAQE